MNANGVKRQLQRILPLLLGAVLSLSAFFAVLFGGIVPRVSAAEGDIFRFEIQIPEEYLAGGEKQDNEFLFTINLSPSDLAWYSVNNVTKTTVLSYDVYSPNPVAGIGFFSAQENVTWKFLTTNFSDSYPATGGMVDADGNPVSSTADLSAYITNGWYHREITLSALSSTVGLAHAVVGVHKAENVRWDPADLVDGNKIVVYYKNMQYDVGGSVMSAVHPSSTPARGLSLYNFTSQQQGGDTLNGALGWQTISPFDEGTTTVKDSITLSAGTGDFTGVDPATAVTDGGVGAEMDFTAMKDAAGAALTSKENFSVTVNGKAAAGGKYTPTEEDAGNAEVVVTFGSGDHKMTYAYTAVIVENLNQYSFKESDFSGIARTADSMHDVVLPAVNAYVQGQATVASEISVTCGGEPVTLTDGENGAKLFRPASSGLEENEYKTTYTVRYFAQDPEDETNTAEFTFEIVSDWVKDPVIDLSALPLNKTADGDYRVDTYGSEVSVPTTVKANDYSDGLEDELIDATLVKVLDPFGDEVTLTASGENTLFRANISTDNALGKYYQLVYESTNDKGFTSQASTDVQVGHEPGMVIHWRVYTGSNEAGTVKATSVTLYGWFNNLYHFLPGDSLSYEMYIPSGIDGAMIDFEFENTWGVMSSHKTSDNVAYFDLEDADGVPMNETPEAAKTGWVTRTFALPSEILNDKNGDATSNYVTHLLLTLNTDDAIEGEYVDIYFRNIKIVSQTTLETVLYDGTHALSPVHKRCDGESGREEYSAIDFAVFSAVDPLPSLDTSKFESRYGTSAAIDLPEDAYFDFYKNAALTDIEITVTDPAGNPVALGEGNTFTATVAGRFTARYKDNSTGAYTEISLLVIDDTFPVIMADGEVPETASVGDTITVPGFTATDNITASADMEITVKVEFTDVNGETSTVTVSEDNTFVIEQAGEYVITATVRDGSGNRTEWTAHIAVEQQSGCGSSIAVSVAAAALLVLAGACAILCKRSKENM